MARALPEQIWLFGSRARGDYRADSDWDLVVSIGEGASLDLLDPMTYWALPKVLGVQATIIPALSSDISDCWGVPNTLGFDLARDGRRLDVGS